MMIKVYNIDVRVIVEYGAVDLMIVEEWVISQCHVVHYKSHTICSVIEPGN
jgi:hypothetical protein